MHGITVIKYDSSMKRKWDEFITTSKNSTFLFYRDYMDYHSDRFIDHSLLFYEGSRLSAVMPANIKDNILYSHGGLTFGGIITDDGMRTPLMMNIFDALRIYLNNIYVHKLVYKAIPHIYHSMPAEEDLYALFRNRAAVVRRDVSSTIFMNEQVKFSKGRKWSINKAREYGVLVKNSHDYSKFMEIEAENLMKKYGVKPTHSAAEIEMLAQRFPDNIKLFVAIREQAIIAGVIIYENKHIVHAQYISSNDDGKKVYAVDLIIDYLIHDYYKDKRYFDFGISTEQEGNYLNVGLIRQKEEYGARAIVYDTYELNII